MYSIRLGIPEMQDFWNNLTNKIHSCSATKDEIKLHKKLVKVFHLLENDPFYNSLHTHEIDILSKRYGMKVWQSYLENRKPAAGRIYWIYYPEGSITIIGLEPHPNDNKNSYDRIKLSDSES